MKLKGDAVNATKDLIAMRREFRQLDTEEVPIEEKTFIASVNRGEKPIENKVVIEWRKNKVAKKKQDSQKPSSDTDDSKSDLDEDLFDDY